MNSGEFDGLSSKEGIARITKKLGQSDLGEESVQYKLRDWLFSRQRYWGEPFPIAWVTQEDYQRAVDSGTLGEWIPENPVSYTDENGKRYALPVHPSSLPLRLPEVESYKPAGTGESPLKNLSDWLEIWYNYETGAFGPASSEKPSGDNWIRATR